MDQKKIGRFLKELRNEKRITQEQAANEFSVAQRTVSRWETGSNMSDLSILVELADFYDVDIREIINGERKSEIMNKDVKETLVNGVYNTADECFVASKIFFDDSFNRIISICSLYQAYKVFLFFLANGIYILSRE